MEKEISATLAILVSLVLSVCAHAHHRTDNYKNQDFDAPKGLPSSYSDFKNRCATLMQTPAGAVKMYFDAIFVYTNPKTRKEGQQMLRYIMRTNANWDTHPNMNTFAARLKDSSKHYIFRSFAQGTSPENDYEMSPSDYSIEISNITRESGYLCVNIISTGAESSRVIQLKQFEDGLWYVINNVGTYADVRQSTNTMNGSFNV